MASPATLNPSLLENTAAAAARRQKANAKNAQNSTGPKTEAGKARSSANAVRHGLTGQRIVLEEEDRIAYFQHGWRWLQALKPVGYVEIKLAQKIIDADWRLDRAAAIEQNLFTLRTARVTSQGSQSGHNTEIALSQATAFEEDSRDSNTFSKIMLYQTRLERSLERFRKMLREEQERRLKNPPAEPVPQLEADQETLNWYREIHEHALQEKTARAAAEVQNQQPTENKEVPEMGSFFQTESVSFESVASKPFNDGDISLVQDYETLKRLVAKKLLVTSRRR